MTATAEEDAERLVVGILRSVPDDEHPVLLQELRRQGFDNRNVRILPSDPGDIYEDASEAQAALRGWIADEGELDLIIAFSTPYASLVSELTPTTPTLFMVNDPVAAGLVVDRDEPEGWMTGLSFRVPADRTLDLAARALGRLDRIGFLTPAADPAVAGHRAAVFEAAEELGIDVVDATFTEPDQVGPAVAELVAADVDAVFLPSGNDTVRALSEIETELDRVGLPAIANIDFVDFAIVALTPDRPEMRRQLARQTARLLAGAEVSAVPVEDPRRFVTIVNRSKAADLGLPELDSSFLRQADLVR